MVSQMYKNFQCISKLNEHADNFDELVHFYADKLNNKVIIDGSVYTVHDFNTHCCNIYKIISEVLFDSERAYDEHGLSEMELYILDLAVLFHDISMSEDLDVQRNNHSMLSAQYVQKQYDDQNTLFYEKCGLNRNALKVLKAIIIAHSDVKDGSVPSDQIGLKNPALKDDMPSNGGTIRAKFLAGILRFADELDVTTDRLGHTNIEDKLADVSQKRQEIELRVKAGKTESTDEEKLIKYRNYEESFTHWKRLYLFSEIRREKQEETVKIITDDEYLQHMLDAGHTKTELAREIVRTYKKINDCLENVREEVIGKSVNMLDLVGIFPVRKIDIKTELEEINNEIIKQIYAETVREPSVSYGDLSERKATVPDTVEMEEKHADTKSFTVEETGVRLLDEPFSKRLDMEIDKRHLLRFGHFRVDGIYCARDWVDTKEIIETRSLSDKIIKCFLENLKRVHNPEKKCLIIGLDIEGALLASRMALGMKVAFSYIIPVREQIHASTKEMEISVTGYDELVFVTDAVVAFDTIGKAIDEISTSNGIAQFELKDRILRIYTIFHRKNESVEMEGTKDLAGKTFCVNENFPVELVEKNKCHYYTQNRCIAMNVRNDSINY